jgi:hypothetical protein
VLTVELRDRRGGTPIQFDILASSGIPGPVTQSQLELAKQLAPAMGIRYYFLVALDEILGWDLSSGALVFREQTSRVLASYATAGDIRQAGPSYLAALVQAWVADLGSRWKSKASPVPGEHAMHVSGALEVIRTSESTTSGSL